jgi:hypothetical protein
MGNTDKMFHVEHRGSEDMKTNADIVREAKAKLAETTALLDEILEDEGFDYETEGDKAGAICRVLGSLWSDIGENYYYGGGSGWRSELKDIWTKEEEEKV